MKKENKTITIELPESAQDFLNYLHTIKNKSDGTCEGYASNLRIFFGFIMKNKKKKQITNKLLKSLKLNDLYNFLTYAEKELNNAPATRARKVACLQSYFKYLHKIAKIVPENIAEELESPDIPKKNPLYLTLEECELLLKSMNKDYKHYERDFAIITLFLHTGMRVSELANMLYENIKGDTLTIVGKGNKERTVYLNESCLKAIKDYLVFRDDYIITDGRIFNIKKQAIEVLVKKNIVDAGIKNGKAFSPHKLRHSASMLMYKYGNVGIAELKDILGHKSISTTNIYAHADNDSLRDAVKSNPLNIL
jgi:site-specific recombinase XerD